MRAPERERAEPSWLTGGLHVTKPREIDLSDRPAAHVAGDGEEIALHSGRQDWVLCWHADAAPVGTRHGSAGLCLAGDRAVLISLDGVRWDLPAGRPEAQETWEETLRREVREEACASVESARLLGFVQGRCVRGREAGLVLVRAFWFAEVTLHPWRPEHEVLHRRLVPVVELFEHLNVERGYLPIYRRAMAEAGLG